MSSVATQGGAVVKQSAGSEEVPPQVSVTGASGTNADYVACTRCVCTRNTRVVCVCSGQLLVYVIIPTIPLLLLILVASGTCCFQMLSRR